MGLVLLYLYFFTTYWFFDAIVLTIAILPSEAALIIAGVRYSGAAILEWS
jgi:hypothetical protein